MRICGHRCERFPPCAPPCCLFFRLFSLFRQHSEFLQGFPDGSQFLLGIGGNRQGVMPMGKDGNQRNFVF